MSETKKPHHFSVEGRALKAQQEAEAQKNEGQGLAQSPNTEIQNTTETVLETSAEVQKEASIPLSQVQDIVKQMLEAERAKTPPPTPQPAQQIIQQVPVYSQKSEYDIDDIPEFKDWEIRDREYELCDGTKPITCSIPRVHSDAVPLQYTNKETKKVYPMRWATNQPSFFMEKQSTTAGSVIVSDICFDYGRLRVPASQINLQKFLHIHQYKDILFKEYDPNAKSKKAVGDRKLKKQAEAYLFDENSEIVNRAIAGVVCENYVPSWSLENLEEQLIAQIDLENGAQKFINLSTDPTIKMKGIVKSALAKGDLIYSNYRWLNGSRELIIEVGKNQDEMDELVKYLESGVGRTFYDYLQNC